MMEERKAVLVVASLGVASLLLMASVYALDSHYRLWFADLQAADRVYNMLGHASLAWAFVWVRRRMLEHGDRHLAALAAAAVALHLGHAAMLLVLSAYWSLGWPPLWTLGIMRRMIEQPTLIMVCATWLSAGEWRVIRAGLIWATLVAISGALEALGVHLQMISWRIG